MTRLLDRVSIALIAIAACVAGCEAKAPTKGHSSSSPATATPSPAAPTTPEVQLPASPRPRIVDWTTSSSAADAWQRRADRVFLPGYDDRPATAPPERLRLDASIFAHSANVYEQRAIVTRPSAESTSFTIPLATSEMGVLVRAKSVEGEWPRVRFSLVDDRQANNRLVVFEGNVAWKELRYLWWPVPQQWRGRQVRLRVELLNPSYYFNQRALYIAAVICRGME